VSASSRNRLALGAVVLTATACAIAAPPAAAFNPIKPVCGVGGLVSGAVAKACSVVESSGGGGVASRASTALALAAVGAWVLGGARSALTQTTKVIGKTTTPQLTSTWFSSSYWRVAGISVLLTVPFLVAAAVQALMRSDLAILVRSAFGYLPLAMLLVGVAAPLTMLLLAASDQMSAIVSSAAGAGSGRFLDRAAAAIGGFTLLSGSPFLVVFAGLLTVGSAMLLWLELTVRAAAVYVIVLMLPLAFAAMVWPARRIWALRAVEILVALILSKFAIVAVLSLGGAAFTASFARSVTGMVAGVALLGLSVCAPWALLRLLPMSELAAGAAAALRGEAQVGLRHADKALGAAADAHFDAAEAQDPRDWATTATAEMRRTLEASSRPAAGEDMEAAPPGLDPQAGQDDAHQRPPQTSSAASSSPASSTADPASAPAPSSASSTPDSPPAPDAAATPGLGDNQPPEPSAPSQRIPGLRDMWQAENGAWESFPLGGWDDGAPPQVWPPGDEDAGPGEISELTPPPQPPLKDGA
jgi:hypothetical protein